MSNWIFKCALKALLYEVSATPKPGLVDRLNSGAHQDMDFYTFIDSSVALTSYFESICVAVRQLYTSDEPTVVVNPYLSGSVVFEKLKPLGIRAEEQMRAATGGVNTHKGSIYALGLLVASTMEWHLVQTKPMVESSSAEAIKQICSRASEYVKPNVKQDFQSLKTGKTYGEQQYLKYGLTGARGEALSGFHSVWSYGLPALDHGLSLGLNLNDAMVLALISLMSNLEDSNVIGRHNLETLEKSKAQAQMILTHETLGTTSWFDALKKYDQWCIEKNISHGGAADLLAVTVYLHLIRDEICPELKKSIAF